MEKNFYFPSGSVPIDEFGCLLMSGDFPVRQQLLAWPYH
jgi:hypothetical protein